MKTLILCAVLFVSLCVTFAAASSSSKKENELRVARSAVVERQDETALAQLYFRLLENEVKQQDFSDEDRAKIESILSKMRNFFHGLGHKIRRGFSSFGSKVKKAFHRG